MQNKQKLSLIITKYSLLSKALSGAIPASYAVRIKTVPNIVR